MQDLVRLHPVQTQKTTDYKQFQCLVQFMQLRANMLSLPRYLLYCLQTYHTGSCLSQKEQTGVSGSWCLSD